ncbi:DUF2752 domain-containing protein [Costertonia aggregata]|uniref:DUF2752 domain-containing protein n=1 Tax=Costertonia aggregata TaxID=343403 RepID=A0A7H9ASG3_9FLAO|nr:DUF2752 domain-containing protein [Costertonia aggregata]QLG46380.1 DUF2752 domain-containing protein [Costertonia aggregata]
MYIIIGALLISIIPLYYFYDPGNVTNFPKCPFYTITGFLCTGCGSQRALHDLLHLNIIGAFKHNMLFIPTLILLSYYLGLKLLEKLNGKNYKNYFDRTKTPRIILYVVLIFTIMRNINVSPFNVFAP